MRKLSDRIKEAIVTGLYMGKMPWFKGTFGTLDGVIVYWLVLYLFPSDLRNWVLGGLVVLITIICLWLGDWAEQYFKQKDPQPFVLDEIAGFLLACLFIKPVPVLILASFVLFRFFDGVKPFPINRSQNLRGGRGIVIDDILAGICANLCLQIISRIVLKN
jgi:phosphatidylglycerophosphatase A